MQITIPQRFRFWSGHGMTVRRMTAGIRVLPDFIIIGAQKSGTTSLFRLLEKHPGIVPAARKEVHYFDNMGHNWRHGVSWYRAHFPTFFKRYYKRWTNHQNAITGEASPYYIFHPLVPKRILDTLPKVKLIAMLRDPVARAYSHYHHSLRKGYESLTFEEAIDQERERLAGEVEKLRADPYYFSFNHAHRSYLSRGLYLEQLMNWHRYFPKEQVLIIRSEDFFADPACVYQQVLAFIGLPEWNLERYSKYNDSGGYEEMSSKMRRQLNEYFRPHNEKLSQYLGMDVGWHSL